jgi:hypothetical protein
VNHLQLPLSFDVDALVDDLRQVDAADWVAHFNTGYYAGDWSGAALRSVDGNPQQIYPDPTAVGRYRDTPLLGRLDHVAKALARFECELTSVRLLRLAAGSSIHEHSDLRLNRAHGEVRIHVPIVTDDQVAFFLDGERVPMQPGQAWYLNLELPHLVDNRSEIDRVHLVIDCVTNDWLEHLLEAGTPSAAPTVDAVTDEKFVSRPDVVLVDPVAIAIVTFIRSLGFAVVAGPVEADSIVPGIRIERGALVVDGDRLAYPGDLLHEAGHLAVTDPQGRSTIHGGAPGDGGQEMASIAWSYAAACHLGIDPAVVFHPGGYRGGSASLLENFAEGRFLGVPLLQWYGLTFDPEQARRHGADPYPAMRAWVRTTTATTASA